MISKIRLRNGQSFRIVLFGKIFCFLPNKTMASLASLTLNDVIWFSQVSKFRWLYSFTNHNSKPTHYNEIEWALLSCASTNISPNWGINYTMQSNFSNNKKIISTFDKGEVIYIRTTPWRQQFKLWINL